MAALSSLDVLATRRRFNTLLAAGLLVQGCAQADRHSSADALEIIDFHSHIAPPGLRTPQPAKGAVPKEIERVFRDLTDLDGLYASLTEQGVTRRVVNTPIEVLAPNQAETRLALCQRINDALAEVCASSNGRLLGLATIDAYAGDEGAAELERAVSELGLLGALVESANGERLISSQEARPTFDMAANLGVPVFVHPVQEMTQAEKFGLTSFYQANLARASINSIALADMLESGVFDDLPALRVCFTTFAISAILFGGLMSMTRPDARALLRRNVFVDTVGVNATLIRATADVLGVDNILLGTDWPIFRGYSIRSRFDEASRICMFDDQQQRAIASGNARKLLRLADDPTR
ncbi:MAG: amidohydrolase family protein [Pseudomonadota bacterium]